MGISLTHADRLKLDDKLSTQQVNFSNNSGFSIKDSNNEKKSSSFFKDNYSSFSGVNSDPLTDETKQDSQIMDNIMIDNCNRFSKLMGSDGEHFISQDFIQYTFTWQEDGNEVFLVGTFGNWTERYQMKKTNKIFTLTLVTNIT